MNHFLNLFRFPETLDLLGKIPVLPCLTTDAHLPLNLRSTTTNSSSNDSATSSVGDRRIGLGSLESDASSLASQRHQTLLDWINAMVGIFFTTLCSDSFTSSPHSSTGNMDIDIAILTTGNFNSATLSIALI